MNSFSPRGFPGPASGARIDLIDDRTSLSDSCAGLAREEALGIDIEADSLHHYPEKVCLLQISAAARDLIVDTLAVRDLSPLGELFSDPGVRKVFHAADYDVRCLKRDFGLEVGGLFDTMVACQFLNEEKIGLADVLEKYAGVSLDKRFQRADWSLRPLPPEMIRYAAEDTRHLVGLASFLEEKLRAAGKLAWAAEEFSLLEEVSFSPLSGPLFLRVKGAQSLGRRELAVLEELLLWREDAARSLDRPPFKVIGGESLLEIARALPADAKTLSGIRGFHREAVGRHGQRLLAAVRRGLARPEESLPSYPRPARWEGDADALRRLVVLKKWRGKTAAALGMPPGIMINNALLEEIATHPPAAVAGLAAFGAMKTWQRRELGEGILAALSAAR